jgi:hypothetical protein
LEKVLRENPSSIRIERLELRAPLPNVPDQVVSLSFQGIEFAEAAAEPVAA